MPLLPGDVHDLDGLDQIRSLLFTGSAPRRPAGSVGAVHILVATDADYVLDDITAALGGPDVSFTVCRNGRDVSPTSSSNARPISSCSTCRSARWAAWPSRWPCASTRARARCRTCKVLMLLDRQADVHLAKRCAADGYLVKPLEPAEPEAGGAGDPQAAARADEPAA